MQSSIVLGLLLVHTVIVTAIIPQEQHDLNIANFTTIADHFNNAQYESLYGMLTNDTQKSVAIDVFKHAMAQFREKYGRITYSTYLGESNGLISYVIAFDKFLDTTVMYWKYGGSRLASFQIVPPQKQSFVEFFKGNPDLGSLTIYNDKVKVVSWNEERWQPICSVLKIPIVLEFAKQVTNGIIDQDTLIPVEQVERYLMKNIDTMWQNFLKWAAQLDLITNQEISLKTIARGMVIFSINANTEFLTEYLGMGNIEQMTKLVHQTRPIYLVSALLAFANNQNLPDEEYLRFIRSMDDTTFYQLQQTLHEGLLAGNPNIEANLARAYNDLLRPEVMEISANWLVNSTSLDYATLMTRINYGEILTPEAVSLVHEILGSATQSGDTGRYLYHHSGLKGGSAMVKGDTNAIFAMAGYSHVQHPKWGVSHYSFAFFTRGLNNSQFANLYAQMNPFILMVMNNAEYNSELSVRLKKRLRRGQF